jgi:hypothetical protein
VLQPYRNPYNDIINRWGSAAISAANAQPADLKAPIEELQQIANDLAALTPPACAQQGHSASLDAMRTTIGGYQNLMGQKDAGAAIRNGIDMLSAARLRINALPGEPAPTPSLPPTNTPLPTFTPAPTFTPLPTKTPTATPPPTPTAEPRQGTLRTHSQVYETPDSDVPVKTLLKGTAVLVFETQKSRIHIRAGDVEGWVTKSAVVIN